MAPLHFVDVTTEKSFSQFVCIPITTQLMLQFILAENHVKICRNKATRAKVLEFIITPRKIELFYLAPFRANSEVQ